MKKYIYLLLCVLMFANSAYGQMEGKMAKRVVMIISERDFRDEELLQPKAVLEKAGVKVELASSTIRSAKGVLGASVMPDKLVSDINVADYDAVVFIGGPGCRQYWNDPVALTILRDAAASDKIVGGICSAAATLALAGILDGKNATVFSGEAQVLRDNGANYTARPVETDGNIVTADGPNSATAFGRELLKKLSE